MNEPALVTEIPASQFSFLSSFPLVDHELSVASVLAGVLPGRIWVDHHGDCGLVKTPECNVLVGTPRDEPTVRALFEHIGYFDPVAGDRSLWGPAIEALHPNRGIRRYIRCSLSRKGGWPTDFDAPVVLIRAADLGNLGYRNSELVTEWVQSVPGAPTEVWAAVVVQDHTVVSCSAVDCILPPRAEIGVKTMPGFRGRGYARACAAALIRALVDQGVEQVGWHCVSTNRRSLAIALALGFGERIEHDSYSPFPPIENDDDLDARGWAEYAQFFEQRAATNPDHCWQAAKCWAKAADGPRALHSLSRLVETGRLWFRDYLEESPEFLPFADRDEWKAVVRGES